MSQPTFFFVLFFLSIFVSPVLNSPHCLTLVSDLGECHSEQVGSDQLLQMYACHLILLRFNLGLTLYLSKAYVSSLITLFYI
jgi:hypothetical protein